MKLKIYQVDAFAEKVFTGNPAAVCPLPAWLSDDIMQSIAAENNLAETAFYVKDGNTFHIRWFTPLVEVDLCGHATLAAAYVLFHHEGYAGETINFHSHRSGALTITMNNELISMDFPADSIQQVDLSQEILDCFNHKPVEVFKGKTDFMVVFSNESQVKEIEVSYDRVEALGGRGVIITAPGERSDFVSRFFAPQVGIKEDPVTGSAHTSLTSYWSKRLSKNSLSAIQLSARGGFLKCEISGDRIIISGKAALYMDGFIYLDEL